MPTLVKVWFKQIENFYRLRPQKYMIGTSVMTESRRSSLIILKKFVLTYCKAERAFFISLSGFSSTDTYYLQDSRSKGKLFFDPLYHFHLLPRLLDISWFIAAESSPLCIAGSRTQTKNFREI